MAVLTIINDDFFGHPTFSTANYNVKREIAGVATITVNRLGGAAQNGHGGTMPRPISRPSQMWIYTAGQWGPSRFAPGEFSKSFTVPVLNNLTQDGKPNL